MAQSSLEPVRLAVLLLMLGFASYRLSMFAHPTERGPYGIFTMLRTWTGRKAAVRQRGFWYEAAELVSCPYCAGVWVSLILAVIVFGFQPLTLLIWLSVAGFQNFLTRVVDHG